MAHITSIAIDGLLGRKDRIKFELNRDVNIFFGENGCGKTTLLKIINAALNRDEEAIAQLPVQRAEISIYSITDNRIIKHVWDRKTSKAALTDKQKYVMLREQISPDEARRFWTESAVEAWKLTPPSRADAGRRWSHTFLPTTRLYISEKPQTRAAQAQFALSESQLDELFSDSLNKAWLLYNSQILQEVRGIQEEGLRAVLHNVLTAGPSQPPSANWDAKATHGRVVNFLGRQPQRGKLEIGSFETFRKRYQTDENLRRAVDNIDDVERKIESAMIPINRFKSIVHTLFSNGKKIAAHPNLLQVALPTGEIISPTNLSSGEKHLLKILLAAMTAGPNSVIIDEPELSMHIDWQRMFVPTVSTLNSDCQLIIASHSPEVMAEISDDKIFKL
jgi:energy-coupling factor transporter ATP-binding protein EcfA2